MSNNWIAVRTAYDKVLKKSFLNEKDREAAHMIVLKLLRTTTDLLLSGDREATNAFNAVESFDINDIHIQQSSNEAENIPVPTPQQEGQQPQQQQQYGFSSQGVPHNINDFLNSIGGSSAEGFFNGAPQQIFQAFANNLGNMGATGGDNGASETATEDLRQLFSFFPFLNGTTQPAAAPQHPPPPPTQHDETDPSRQPDPRGHQA